MYLSPEDVAETLHYAGLLAAGTTIVFDYYLPVDAVGFIVRLFYKSVLKRLEDAGEPWLSFYTPETIRASLSGRALPASSHSGARR